MADVMTPEQMQDAYELRVRQLTRMLESRERQLAILSAVAVRTHDLEDSTQILDIALQEILQRLDLTAGWVFLGKQEDRVLSLAASRGVAQAYLDEIERDGLGTCLCPEVFWTGHLMQARNTTECPRMPTIVEGLPEPTAHACVPLRFEGNTRGVLNVAARPGERFGADELDFLETLGRQVCVAIERGQHARAERLRNQEARAMAAVSKAMGGSLDPHVILAAVGSTAREILEVDRVRVLLGTDPRRMHVAHLSGFAQGELQEGQGLDLVALEAKGHLLALEERRLVRVDDWLHDERVNPDLAARWETASALVLPLAVGQSLLGLLVLARAAASPWSEEQVDVAESLAAQASVALENARLYEQSRAAYEELKGAQRRLVQNEKMVLLGTFASGLAHEIRNPLNSIGLQLSILERRIAKLESSVSTELAELAGVIRGEIRRLDALVGDFLLFSRTNRLQYQQCDLEQLTDQVLRLLRPEARQTNVALRRQRLSAQAIPVLTMDPEKMKQVVINLVRNAIEALPAGGVVTIETGVVEHQARLVVRDDGPGIPPGLDIFQLFVTTKPRGTGLGLSLVQQIVVEHGGEVSAQNAAGSGAVFTVSLPLAPALAASKGTSA
jgi:signal transduction histidine kinase/putative methionine-R-sulfoxide reductase with GAF domain